CRVVVGGESLPGVAELPDGRQCHRGEPRARRPDGRGATRDEASARARPHAAHLQSRGLAPDPPTGGPRDLRGWGAEGRAAGIGAALFRVTRRSSSDAHVIYWHKADVVTRSLDVSKRSESRPKRRLTITSAECHKATSRRRLRPFALG